MMIEAAIEHLIYNCIESDKEKVLLLYDDTTEAFVPNFLKELIKAKKRITKAKVSVSMHHGEEPEANIRLKMLQSDAIICLTQHSLAHTGARKEAEKCNIPFLSLPGYNADVLASDAIFVDYRGTLPVVKLYSDVLSKGVCVEVQTELGTDITMNIKDRVGNCCPGFTDHSHLLGSPPDIEANIAPVEFLTQGCIVVDGSITDRRIGLLNQPVILMIKEGKVCNIESKNEKYVKTLEYIFQEAKSDKAYIVGEFGIGFNDKAHLCGNMLVDEGAMGCVHFGIGSNWTIGGKNQVDFHLDFVTAKATVKVDGNIVIDKGELVL